MRKYKDGGFQPGKDMCADCLSLERWYNSDTCANLWHKKYMRKIYVNGEVVNQKEIDEARAAIKAAKKEGR